MPRLTNSLTGVVVNVDEETASRLSSEWESADEAPAKAPAKKAAATKSEK